MILKISEAANLGIHAMTFLATRSEAGQAVPTPVMAEAMKVSHNHLSKVLQRLTKAGLVRAVRGPRGGFVLADEPQNITLSEIYESIDGALPAHGHCLMGEPTCGLTTCVFGGLIEDVHRQVSTYLKDTTLADFTPEG